MTAPASILLNLLLLQNPPADPPAAEPKLAAQIGSLVHTVMASNDDAREEAAMREAKEIFRSRGFPSIADVGDDASYALVYLICETADRGQEAQVLEKVHAAAQASSIPRDAEAFCAAHLGSEAAKREAKRRPPSEPALRDRIEELLKTDQAVRQQQGFDMEKMMQVDRQHAAVMEDIFSRYGAPTYAMVGPKAAGDFVIMVQHQSPELRARVLPKLKQNVDANQADPESYTLVYDRTQNDAGKPQRYGQNFVCDATNPRLHPSPMEDPANVDQRRASMGLMRLKLYAQMIEEDSPDVCKNLKP